MNIFKRQSVSKASNQTDYFQTLRQIPTPSLFRVFLSKKRSKNFKKSLTRFKIKQQSN